MAWFEEFLIHGPGPLPPGTPYRLHDDLKLLTWQAYELWPASVNRTKRHRWTEVVIELPKGVAKSELLGAICCAEALGPVEFAGWDANGNPVGRPVERAEVLIFANDEEQTGNCYLNVATMLDPEQCTQALLDEYGEVDIGRSPESSTRTVLPDHRGEIKPQTARSRSKEGGKPTFVANEETHLWVLPAMHSLHQTARRGLRSKPQGRWMCHATNTYGPGEGSVLELLDKDRAAGNAKSLLWFANRPSGIPDGIELRDLPEPVLMEGLRTVYGSAAYVDFPGIIEEIQQLTTEDAHARRFFFNLKASAQGKWMPAAAWADVEDKTIAPLAEGDQVALGFDGSRKHDATAIVACRLTDMSLWQVRLWEQPRSVEGRLLEGWEVKSSEVDAAVGRAMDTWRVALMYGDPPYWQSELERWALDFGDEVVLAFETNRDKQMAYAIERFTTATLTNALRWSGQENLRRHVLNANKVDTRYGYRLTKGRPGEYIDLAVAAILAHEAACDAIAAGALSAEDEETNIW